MGVELGYNSDQSVPCSVKYRDGVWHEATITYDGRTTTLYLDGVAGCRTDAPLQAGNDKVILLTHFGGAATFYGLLRNLTITNGVVAARRMRSSSPCVGRWCRISSEPTSRPNHKGRA